MFEGERLFVKGESSVGEHAKRTSSGALPSIVPSVARKLHCWQLAGDLKASSRQIPGMYRLYFLFGSAQMINECSFA